MSLLTRRLGLVLSLSVLPGLGSLGCSHASADTVTSLPPAPPDTAAVVFDDPGTLTLPWGATQALSVTATPSMVYRVGFSLVGVFDDAFDGSLDSAVVLTDATGHGAVMLHAPSQSTTFSVRASLLDPSGVATASADRVVSVSQQGFGAVRVTPAYLGHRAITSWSASVATSTTCAELESQSQGGAVPADPQGAISASAPLGADPLVMTAPVGPNLAVLVRAGHFAWGCAEVSTLTAGSTLDVPITVVDVPLDLQAADLVATFAYTPDPTGYATVLGDAASALVDAFMPLSSSEGTIVLNGMAAATTDPATFAELRVDQSWDTLAEAHFDALPESLRDACGGWATAGVAAQPTSFKATLTGGSGGQLIITVDQFGSFANSAAGVSVMPGATWSGLADDSVQLNATLLWQPSRFAGVASLGPAVAATGASSVSDALASLADCPGLAATLGAFGSCDVACVANLCVQAIDARWTAALGASTKGAALGQLAIQGAGSCTVGDVAQPLTLTGAWQGQLGDPTIQVPLKGGSLTGAVPAPPDQP
jgi:hypothetical protein